MNLDPKFSKGTGALVRAAVFGKTPRLRLVCSKAERALFGFKLQIIREHYFGKSTVGRPRKQLVSGGSKTWNEMLVERIGINEVTGWRWIKLASIVEGLAERDGTGLREICEKLPWDWTPEETQLMTSTVEKITAIKPSKKGRKSLAQNTGETACDGITETPLKLVTAAFTQSGASFSVGSPADYRQSSL